MSDHYTILAFQDSTAESYESDAKKLTAYFISRNLIIKDNENVFRPGSEFLNVLENPEYYHPVSWNHVEILEGRQIFSEAEGAEFFLTCESCKTTFNGFESPHIDLIEAFFVGSNEVFACPTCHHQQNLRLSETKGFAAGFLGIQFWNWGLFKEEFIQVLSVFMKSKIIVIDAHL